jgi:hypothetical protein
MTEVRRALPYPQDRGDVVEQSARLARASKTVEPPVYELARQAATIAPPEKEKLGRDLYT